MEFLKLEAKNMGTTLEAHCRSLLLRDHPEREFLVLLDEMLRFKTLEEVAALLGSGATADKLCDLINGKMSATRAQVDRLKAVVRPVSHCVFVAKIDPWKCLDMIFSHVPPGEADSIEALARKGKALRFGVKFCGECFLIANRHPYIDGIFLGTPYAGVWNQCIKHPYLAQRTGPVWMHNRSYRCTSIPAAAITRKGDLDTAL